MPVEPPVSSPESLDEAYATLAAGNAWRPIAGGTDLMVQITGEIGPPPERVLDLWRLGELRSIALDDGALGIGALATFTRHPSLRTVPGAPAGAGGRSGDYRCRPDSEPGNVGRQRDQCLAGG